MEAEKQNTKDKISVTLRKAYTLKRSRLRIIMKR